MTASLQNSMPETCTADVETYKSLLMAYRARRVPMAGLVKRYAGESYDDFGGRHIVLVSSTERVVDGKVTWTEYVAN